MSSMGILLLDAANESKRASIKALDFHMVFAEKLGQHDL